jgi:hypothetical protein
MKKLACTRLAKRTKWRHINAFVFAVCALTGGYLDKNNCILIKISKTQMTDRSFTNEFFRMTEDEEHCYIPKDGIKYLLADADSEHPKCTVLGTFSNSLIQMFDDRNSGFALEKFLCYSFGATKTTHFMDVVNLVDISINGKRYPNVQVKWCAHSENASDNPKESYSCANWHKI